MPGSTATSPSRSTSPSCSRPFGSTAVVSEQPPSIERLRQEADELRASRARLVLAADADRRRIERELHDGAQQDLVGLAVKLQQARRLVDSDPAAAGVLVEEMRSDVQEALDRLRSLAQRIHPPQLEA